MAMKQWEYFIEAYISAVDQYPLPVVSLGVIRHYRVLVTGAFALFTFPALAVLNQATAWHRYHSGQFVTPE